MLDVEIRIKVYLEDAEGFLREAFEEFENSVKANNMVGIRDAAEKAWNAVVQATNALLLYYTGKIPSSHWERRRMLRELERLKPEFEKLGFRDRYSARERNLHELVFYEGLLNIEDIKFELEKARRYIEDVKSTIKL